MAWNLYVLKYKRTGNYYVGTAPDWRDRIYVHQTKTSSRALGSQPSELNKSNAGFYYFVYGVDGFEIDESRLGTNQSVSKINQSISYMIENELAEYLRKCAKEEIIVNGGCFPPTSIEKIKIIAAAAKEKTVSLSKTERLLFEKELPEIFKCEIGSVAAKKTIKMINVTNKEGIRLNLLESGEL
ncbi:hypothetical protein ACYSNR_08330 [Enterococcus sp. LJL128]